MILKYLEECNTLGNCRVEHHFYKPQRNYPHLVRHVRNCVEELFKRAYNYLEYRKLEIETLEYLFNMDFENLWSCPTHAHLERHANACHKWIHRIKDLTHDMLESLYYVLHDILRHLWPRDTWDECGCIPLQSCLEDIVWYIEAFDELVEIVDLIKRISDSDYVKKHKEFLLRQVWKRARENPLVERELKYYPFPSRIRACLSIYKALERVKKSVDFWLESEISEIRDEKGFFEDFDALIAWDHFVNNFLEKEAEVNG